MSKLLRIVLAAAVLTALPLCAENTSAAGAEEPLKALPADVEVHLRDGTVLRGQLKNIAEIPLKTNYGSLRIPLADMLSFSRGKRPALPSADEISAAVKALASTDAAERARAQEILELVGQDALEPLFESRSKAKGEVRERIDALLKRILAQHNQERLELDQVNALKFKGRGIVELPVFAVQSRLGLLQLKGEEIASMRWLAGGTVRKLELEAPAALREWLDTGIDASSNDPITVSCFGQITVLETLITPNGTTNWNSRPFRAGAVVAKLGADGEPFLIGNRKRWLAESSQRLYLKIFLQDDMQGRDDLNNSSGNFEVKIGSGTWADDPSLQSKD